MRAAMWTAIVLGGMAGAATAQSRNGDEWFRPLEDALPTPTAARAASGAPGHAYWQQQADYVIEAVLDEATHRLTGTATITYHNNSPDALRYLWVQLDQNYERPDSEAHLGRTTGAHGRDVQLPYTELGSELMRRAFPGGYDIQSVTDRGGAPLPHTVVGTMMRIDLPAPLAPGQRLVFKIAWAYTIREISIYSHRTGFELVEGDEKNPIYTIAHWYPRLAAYSDRYGWHVHQYLGEEFALEFGDFYVKLTVPADHVVAATGELENAAVVLTPEQLTRFEQSRTAAQPVFVRTVDEAKAAEAGRATTSKTWAFAARNVRDFAWASSRKYAWDAMGVKLGERTVMAMSVWPKEGEPLWSRYSTHAVAHTIEHYSRLALEYPYPVAWSCNGAVGGMEHPMVSFQIARPEKDGTYSARQKYGLVSVIIHEVGHNWFPMIINNDERRWRFLDEGFNSFVQQNAETVWEKDYPTRNHVRRRTVLDYMARADDQPIMTDAEVILEGGTNAYAKTTLALTVLRESVLGRERFDFAFREYCRRWAFKRPMPADFFRSMEDAAGEDLDWFFRGWFFSTDHVDLGITGVRRLRLDTRDPDLEKPLAKAEKDAEVRRPLEARSDAEPKRVDAHAGLTDFYNEFDEHGVTDKDREDYKRLIEGLKPHERELLKTGDYLYVVEFANAGGLPMPMPLELRYADGSTETRRLPATIWRRAVGGRISKLLLPPKPLQQIVLDPQDEMADVDLVNNFFPQRIADGVLRLTSGGKDKNPMQLAAEAAKAKEEAEKKKAAGSKPGGK